MGINHYIFQAKFSPCNWYHKLYEFRTKELSKTAEAIYVLFYFHETLIDSTTNKNVPVQNYTNYFIRVTRIY